MKKGATRREPPRLLYTPKPNLKASWLEHCLQGVSDLNRAETERFLREGRILRIASIDQDGTPHLVPVWYIYEDGKLYFATSDTSRKANNIMKNGKVAFCVDIGEAYSDLKAVVGRGDAKVITEGTLVENKGRKILLKYLGDLNHPVAKELAKLDNCVIEISPTRSRSWDYSK